MVLAQRLAAAELAGMWRVSDVVTDELLVENTPIAAALALLIVGLLAWRFRPSRFRSLSWPSFSIAAALFWGLLAALLTAYAWDFYYSFFAPSWNRYVAPLGAIVLYSILVLPIRWLALRLPGNPVVWFCLLGGLESIPEHAVAITRFGILELPLLRGSTAPAIFIFAYFEYVVYWGLALALTIPVDRVRQAWRLRVARARDGHEEGSQA